MILQMAPPSAIWIISGVCIAMSLFSQWFSKRFSIPKEQQMETQRQIQDLQTRMKDARGNQEAMMEMNQEMMKLMQGMYKKQIIPMCIRSVSGYTEFLPFTFVFGKSLFSLYILVSLGFSVILMGGKMIARKLNPEKHAKKEVVVDHINALDNNIMYAPENGQNQPQNTYSPPDRSYSKPAPQKDWKKRLDE